MKKEKIEFAFIADKDAHAYLVEVVNHMMNFFGISQEEAIERINRGYAGMEVVGSPEENWLYYEMPEDQAKFIYYEVGTYWWVEGSPLKPKPYP